MDPADGLLRKGSTMKIAIVDTYYSSFLAHAEPRFTGQGLDYAGMLERLLSIRFGTSDFYSRNLRAIGHDAIDIVYNCLPLQQRWAKENVSRRPGLGSRLADLADLVAVGPRRDPGGDELRRIAVEQIRSARPDVLFMQELSVFPPEVLTELKRSVRLVVGQIASPLPDPSYLKPYDLILTSFPHFVPKFRVQGIASEYFRIGFDPIVLDSLGTVDRKRACTFVGGISGVHGARTRFLETLAREVDIEFFGYGADMLPPGSAITSKHQGEAWALDMYRVLAESLITVNFHIDVAENNANNMRLYEATGCGALLVTDQKQNLAALFKPGTEVVAYRDADEAVGQIRHFLDHPVEARKIAAAGQQRTLGEHTYAQRMAELTKILERHLPPQTRMRSIKAALISIDKPSAVRAGAVVRIGDGDNSTTQGPTYLDAGAASVAAARLKDTWKDAGIPELQLPVVEQALNSYRRGQAVPVFDSLIEIMREGIGSLDGRRLLEIGCSSGYYAEAFEIKKLGVDYEGADLSPSFVAMARERYPHHRFSVEDATALNYADESFDIVVSGCCLLHIPDYERAICEAARVSRRWVALHRTPVLQQRPTRALTKTAYDVEMFEQHFNEGALFAALARAGLAVVGARTIEALWDADVGDCLSIKTYLCMKAAIYE